MSKKSHREGLAKLEKDTGCRRRDDKDKEVDFSAVNLKLSTFFLVRAVFTFLPHPRKPRN